MGVGPGKDRDGPARVLEAKNPVTTGTGTPRTPPAEAASPPPFVVEQPGEERIPSISGSAVALVDREGKNFPVLSPSPSSHGSTGSTSSADAAEEEESAKSSAPPPSSHGSAGSTSSADAAEEEESATSSAPPPSPASPSTSSTLFVDAEVAEQLARDLEKDTRLTEADGKQVIWPQAKDAFLNNSTGHCKNKLADDISENGHVEERKVGNKVPLMEIAVKYKHNSTFMQKFLILNEKYCFVRKIDGDGSCFYRSFLFSYLEKAVSVPNKDDRTNEANRLRKCIANGMNSCLFGRHRMTNAQFQRAFSDTEFLMELIEAGIGAEEFYERELTDSITSRFLPLLRTLAEIELCARESHYEWFLTDHDSISESWRPLVQGYAESSYCVSGARMFRQELCAEEVRCDDGEASNLTIQAVVNALGIATILGCVAMGDGGVEMTLSPDSGDVSPVAATLLYIPGHYDVLYAS